MKAKIFTALTAIAILAPACRHQTTTTTAPADFTVTGRLIIGHEVRSFIADGDTTEYWIIDETDSLKPLYEKSVGERSEPYTAVKASLRVVDDGKSANGFAAEYDGVYRVKEVIEVSPMPCPESPAGTPEQAQ